MAERVKVSRRSQAEGERLLRIVRRGESKQGGNAIRWRRATMILASAGGNTVPVIARLGAADEDTVRAVIHRFNELRLDCLGPDWAGRRTRLPAHGHEGPHAGAARPHAEWGSDYLGTVPPKTRA